MQKFYFVSDAYGRTGVARYFAARTVPSLFSVLCGSRHENRTPPPLVSRY